VPESAHRTSPSAGQPAATPQPAVTRWSRTSPCRPIQATSAPPALSAAMNDW
jgi:hypothetical protein